MPDYLDDGFDEQATHVSDGRASQPRSRPRVASIPPRAPARPPSFDERLDGFESEVRQALTSIVGAIENRQHRTRASDAPEIVPLGTRITRWLGDNVLALLAIAGAAGVGWLQLRDEWKDAQRFREAAAETHDRHEHAIDDAKKVAAEGRDELRRAVTEVQVTQVEGLDRVEDLIRDAHPRLEAEPESPTLRDAKAAAKRAKAAGDLFRDETGGI